jgi:hypothetical protein
LIVWVEVPTSFAQRICKVPAFAPFRRSPVTKMPFPALVVALLEVAEPPSFALHWLPPTAVVLVGPIVWPTNRVGDAGAVAVTSQPLGAAPAAKKIVHSNR